MTHGPDPSMTPKEEEEFLLLYGPQKERKALKKRRKARQLPSKSPASLRPSSSLGGGSSTAVHATTRTRS